MEFKNEETAARFEALTESDVTITRQGLYHGKLSNITPKVAEGMVKRKSNLVKVKDLVQEAETIIEKPEIQGGHQPGDQQRDELDSTEENFKIH
jgi:hypothetical protein